MFSEAASSEIVSSEFQLNSGQSFLYVESKFPELLSLSTKFPGPMLRLFIADVNDFSAPDSLTYSFHVFCELHEFLVKVLTLSLVTTFGCVLLVSRCN